MTTVVGAVETLHASFAAAGIPHAFGGAIALAYGIAEPRGTIDVDVNVFRDASGAEVVFAALPAGVSWASADVERAVRDGQVRLFWDDTAIDLFFDNHPFHEHAAANVMVVPFGEITIPVLDPQDLAVFKAFFNRSQDWVDIEHMLEAGSIDVETLRRWLVRLLGEDDQRLDRLRRIHAEVEARGGVPPEFPPLPPR